MTNSGYQTKLQLQNNASYACIYKITVSVTSSVKPMFKEKNLLLDVNKNQTFVMDCMGISKIEIETKK